MMELLLSPLKRYSPPHWIIIPSYFTVVIAAYPFEEQFRDFWNTYGDLIGLVGGGFAAGFSALLIDRLKNRSKNKSRKIVDWSQS
jgi:hypothetical protein